jgi:excisionase family DNA binding protein
MLLSVQLAARRMGVSPHTIRRWTASGFLPCTRTAGGHRRIRQEDIDEIASAIGDSNHLAARLARERELETLVTTSVALSSQLDLTELLVDIAKRMTSLLDCHFCAISDYDEETRTVRMLADFDHSGRRWPDWNPYSLNEFPLTKRLMTEQEVAVVNVSDPAADPGEVAIMRRNGDKSLLLLPLVYRGRSVGLLEVLDHLRERRFSRQEMRLARALAAQASVALQNAKTFSRLRRSDHDVHLLREALARATDAIPAILAATRPDEVLQLAASGACRALNAISSVAVCGDLTAGASAPPQAPESKADATALQSDAAHVVVSSAPSGAGVLTITATLTEEAGDGAAEVLRLVAAVAGVALAALPPADAPSRTA